MAYADTNAGKRTAAQAMFEEARRLVDEGRHAEACPKFRESQSLDPGIGTLYNLGECLETIGQTASAWAAFHEAADMARNADQGQRELAARNRALALEPRLLRLKIDVPVEARVAGLEVKRDGIAVGQGQWGVALPVDPGAHTILVTAPGRIPVELKAEVSEEGTTTAVRIEPLQEQSIPPAAPPAPVAAPVVQQPGPQPAPITGEPHSNSQETWGWVLSGVGLVGVGVGSFVAFSAKSKYDESLDFCEAGDPNRCGTEGVSLRDDARSRGNIATVAMGLGAAALTGGVVLLLSAPTDSDATAARIETGPVVAQGGASWMLRGAF